MTTVPNMRLILSDYLPEETKAFRTIEGGRGKIDMFTLLAESGYDWGSKK